KGSSTEKTVCNPLPVGRPYRITQRSARGGNERLSIASVGVDRPDLVIVTHIRLVKDLATVGRESRHPVMCLIARQKSFLGTVRLADDYVFETIGACVINERLAIARDIGSADNSRTLRDR